MDVTSQKSHVIEPYLSSVLLSCWLLVASAFGSLSSGSFDSDMSRRPRQFGIRQLGMLVTELSWVATEGSQPLQGRPAGQSPVGEPTGHGIDIPSKLRLAALAAGITGDLCSVANAARPGGRGSGARGR